MRTTKRRGQESKLYYSFYNFNNFSPYEFYERLVMKSSIEIIKKCRKTVHLVCFR